MPKKILPRIILVSPLLNSLSLRVRWTTGEETDIDVSGPIHMFKLYEPLRHSAELFARVRVGEHGTDIIWTDEIDMSADTLRRLADEQRGVTMAPEAFRLWREKKAYTLDSAARALGLSRRTVAYYEQGDKPIPRVVALATKALQ
ncbi:MAG: helix-turn-helix transcriptional regulator [Pseudomonadota bacterium]